MLHIIHGFGAGGAETWLLSAVRYLRAHEELGLHFDFLATGGIKERFDDEVMSMGSSIYYLPYRLQQWRAFRKAFRKILREGHYDAVHDHQDFISGWHFLFAGAALPPIRITHLHNPFNFVRNYVNGPGRWISYRLGRLLTAWYATRITGTSDLVMDEYGYDKWPFQAKRIPPVYCGIETERFSYNPVVADRVRRGLNLVKANTKIVLFVGRIGLQDGEKARNQKNPEFALEVTRKLVESDNSWIGLFAGYKGRAGEEMEKSVNEAGLGERIRFLGIHSDVPALMAAADVLLFPSEWEGLGMVAVEAQCSGLRVAMSDAVPKEAVVCPELVRRLSLEVGARIWADTIREFCNIVPSDRIRFQQSVRQSSFSIDHSVLDMKAIYRLKDEMAIS